MKQYCLFEALIHHEKTIPFVTSAKALFAKLDLNVPTLKGAKADVGHEFLGLNQQKFLEHNAYTLALAAKEAQGIVCVEQSSFISLSLTKELLSNDDALRDAVAYALQKKNVLFSLEVEVLSLEQFLRETVGEEKLKTLVQRPFSNFQAALFRGNAACRARKYNDEAHLNTLLDSIGLKRVAFESAYESDGFEILDASDVTAYKLAAKAMLDMFDNAADFVVVSDARSFMMFDFYQKELEKTAGREINLTVFTTAELLGLAMGENDKKVIGLHQHKVAPTLI
jgi:succinate dehydrogenase / fumarate reductase cytochrome b subunit